MVLTAQSKSKDSGNERASRKFYFQIRPQTVAFIAFFYIHSSTSAHNDCFHFAVELFFFWMELQQQQQHNNNKFQLAKYN